MKASPVQAGILGRLLATHRAVKSGEPPPQAKRQPTPAVIEKVAARAREALKAGAITRAEYARIVNGLAGR